jgi:MoxR-like ATPase
MDRFLFRLSMGYPERDCELQILDDHREGEPVDEVQSVCDASWLREAKQLVRRVFVEPSIAGYLLDVVQATRHSTFFRVGASTRGALLWYRATQASAFLDGRAYVVPDDAKQLAIKVLAHRVKAAGNQGIVNRPELESMMSEVVGSVPVPN